MKFKTTFQAIAFSGLVYCGSASASTLEEAWSFYDQSNYSKAAEGFRDLKPIPPQGLGALCRMAVAKNAISDAKADLQYCKDGVAANDPYSLVWLGLAYIDGNKWLGLQRDLTLGLGYLANAVTANFPVASEVLCDYFYRDSKFGRAAPFCKVAATSNLPGGLYHLALMSIEGKGAVQDFDKGRKFALLSASLNYFDAYMLLGEISKTGNYGKPKDLVAAYAWYALAGAAAPDSDDPRKERDALALDPSKVEEAQKLASKWKKGEPQKWRNLYAATAK